MKKNYKDILAFVILPLLIVMIPFISITYAGESAKSYDFYFKPTNDNTQPAVIPEAPFLKDYSTIYMGNSKDKVLYLTFDAGFDNGCHEKILKALKEKNVKGAFFVDGNFLRNQSELAKEIEKGGHLLCNHSNNHPDMTKYTDFDSYSKQITNWEKSAKDIGVKGSKFFRFPCGRFSQKALDYNEKLGLKTVFWSFAYYDWDQNKQPSEDEAIEKIMSRVHNGCVLLLHSTSETNAKILPKLIDKLRNEGYEFKTLNEFK